jgi:hypothetical protein
MIMTNLTSHNAMGILENTSLEAIVALALQACCVPCLKSATLYSVGRVSCLSIPLQVAVMKVESGSFTNTGIHHTPHEYVRCGQMRE